MKITEYEIELIESAFETFGHKSTEFILCVASEEVAESLSISYEKAFDLVMDYLYAQSLKD